jgi:hypothetical protein
MARPRYHLNVIGAFYVEDGCCMTSCIALAEAPDLLAMDYTGNRCYFKRLPVTTDDVNAVVQAMMVSEADCLRYEGSDAAILRRLTEMHLGTNCDVLEGKSEEEYDLLLGIVTPPKPDYSLNGFEEQERA